MDTEAYVDAQNSCVCADSANRISQACAEAMDAMALAGDCAGSASVCHESQRAMRRQARDIMQSLLELSKTAAHAAGVAAGSISPALADARRMAHVDAGAAERNARKCFGIGEQCAKAWGVL